MIINRIVRKHNPNSHKGRIAILIGVMAILLLFMPSCHHRPATLQFQPIDLQGWRANDTLFFEVDSLESGGRYSLYAAVRTSAANPYDFRQLVMEVRQSWLPTGCERVDTIEFQISAPDGEIEGRGVTIFSYELPVDSITLEVGARGHIEINHLMRRSPLHGISDVGIHLKKQ